MSTPLISFVIPLFNHLAQTQAMLQSLLASLPRDLDYEIIFYDDASSDGTQEWLQSLNHPRIHYFIHSQNCGYAKTNNDAIRYAKGDYLVLLNNDLLFVANWLEPMIETLENPKLNAGIVGNVQYRVDDHAIDHAGVILTPRGQFDHLRVLPEDTTQAISVYVVTGACMLIRKVDFDAVSGFDEVFINGCEDIDLCLKIRGTGKQVYLEPCSRILHHVSLSRNSTSIQNEKNSQYLFAKWRKEIKRKLTKCWIDLLARGKSAYEPYIDGELTNSFLTRPHIAAMTIAEAALLREEANWDRELGKINVDNWERRIRILGLKRSEQTNGFIADSEIEISIEQIKSVRNFYVCGRVLQDFDPKCFNISILINNNQVKNFFIDDNNLNIGIINPLIEPWIKNIFQVKISLDEKNKLCPRANENFLKVTHFVIDDKIIKISI